MRYLCCDACGRHVREEDQSCVFCGGTLSAPERVWTPSTARGAFVLAATIAAGVEGCVIAQPAYGVPAPDVQQQDAAQTEAGGGSADGGAAD